MTKSILRRHIQLHNMFPAQDSVFTTMSPLTIVTGTPPPSYHDFQLELGAYVQAHKHPKPTNNMDWRAYGAIALYPSNNNNGWYFMSLVTGKKINRYNWTEIPMTKQVGQRVDQLAQAENLPISKNGAYFEWTPGVIVEDLEHENDPTVSTDFVEFEGADNSNIIHTTENIDMDEAIQMHEEPKSNFHDDTEATNNEVHEKNDNQRNATNEV